jgi:hypothetical protein
MPIQSSEETTAWPAVQAAQELMQRAQEKADQNVCFRGTAPKMLTIKDKSAKPKKLG